LLERKNKAILSFTLNTIFIFLFDFQIETAQIVQRRYKLRSFKLVNCCCLCERV